MLFRERQQILIFVTAGVMVAGFVLFRYLPLRKKMKAVEKTQAAQALVFTKDMAKNEQLPSLIEEFEKLQSKVSNYERQIPADRELGAFLHKIADLMNSHNLKGQFIEPGEEVEGEELNYIPVNMKCRGRLKQIFEFYKSLQSLERLVRIEEVKLLNENNFSGEVNMQTQAVVYYRPQSIEG
jgi:Tfp pilus assembly protein PilO